MLERLKFRPDKVISEKRFLGLKNQKFLALIKTNELSIELGVNRRILSRGIRWCLWFFPTLLLSKDTGLFHFRVNEKKRAKTRLENHPPKNRKIYFILKPNGNKA